MLNGHVSVITGAAGGIGAATARVLAQRGARVVVADVLDAEGEGVVVGIRDEGGEARYTHTDVTSETQCARLMGQTIDAYGRIDSLVCCAGILRGSMIPVEEMDESVFEAVLDVNLKGCFRCVKHAVPHLRATGRGFIVLIASGAGVRGPSSSFAYGASKGGVHGLSLTLAARLEPEGIRVHAVCPAAIDTPLLRRSLAERAEALGETVDEAALADRLGDPVGVCQVLAFLVSPDADYVRGTVFTR